MEGSRQAADRNRMLIEAGVALASELDLEAILDRIVGLAIEITDARYGALGVIGSDGRIERFLTQGISAEQRLLIGDPPTGHGILGFLIERAEPLRIDDLMTDPRAYGFPPNHPEMHSFLGAPVRARGHVFGNIYLTEKRSAPVFDADDEAALTVLATQAGVAIENARLYEETSRAQEELRRLEVFEERERIAKELHDGVIQSLFAVGMSLQGVTAMTPEASVVARLENAVEEIDATIRDLRNYIFGLRPGILADRHLAQALRDMGEEFGSKSGVLTVVDIDDEAAAELASKAAELVQIAREALSNVGRHAGATTCRVSLRRAAAEGYELEVDDDGVGFDATLASAGMGLKNLRGRVDSLGGSLSIESHPEQGTTLIAHLPDQVGGDIAKGVQRPSQNVPDGRGRMR